MYGEMGVRCVSSICIDLCFPKGTSNLNVSEFIGQPLMHVLMVNVPTCMRVLKH